jgi:periplasmic protein TonB
MEFKENMHLKDKHMSNTLNFTAMFKKKNDQSNLEKKRVLFFELGVIISLALLLVAFEWESTELPTTVNIASNTGNDFIDLIVPITRAELPKPKPPMMPIEFTVIKEADIDFEEPDFEWTSDIGINDGVNYWQNTDEPAIDDGLPFVKVEKMPSYKGQDMNYFQKHLQQLVQYPREAQDANISGKVFVEFVVDENGYITHEKIVKSPHESLSEAVLLALDKTDRWKPGEQLGIKVKVRFTVPVYFKLNN